MPTDIEDLVSRLRLSAEAIPHELYSWLHPLLIEAADEIEKLDAESESYYYAMMEDR